MKLSAFTRATAVAAAFATAATGGLVAAPAGAAVHDQLAGADCFSTTDWQGWSAPTPERLLIRVRNHKIYEVTLSGGSYQLKSPGSFLINEVRGSNRVCSAIDLDLSVADDAGFKTRLIPQSIRRLSPQEIAAIPKKDLP